MQQDRVRQLATRAYEVIEESLGADSPPHVRLRAALAVIEAAKGLAKDVGPTSREALEYQSGVSVLGSAIYLHMIGDLVNDREKRRETAS